MKLKKILKVKKIPIIEKECFDDFFDKVNIFIT